MSDKDLSKQLADIFEKASSAERLAHVLQTLTGAINESSAANGQAMADIADAVAELGKKDGQDKAIERVLTEFKAALVKAVAGIKVGVTVPQATPPSVVVQPATVTAPAVTVQAPKITIPAPHVVIQKQPTSMRMTINRSERDLIESIDISFGEA
jgi:hypothetical protein